jgi:hypothetical protein
MAAVVRVHRPVLTPEEREKQMDRIRKATIEIHKSAIMGKKER